MVIVMMNMMTFMMISTTLYSRCVSGTARCSGEAECTDASDEFEYVKDERIMMMMKLGADLLKTHQNSAYKLAHKAQTF